MSVTTQDRAPSRASGGRPRIVVVGSGFAGFHCARRLRRRLPQSAAEIVLISPTDYLLYTPLLPEVATGSVEARHIAVPLRQALPGVSTVLGRVTSVYLEGRTVTVTPPESPPGSVVPAEPDVLSWDRLVLTPGSVTRQFDIPGVLEHAHGLKTLSEALFLRDHLLEQFDLADSSPDTAQGRAERQARLTVVAVGAGYTGTEFVAQAQNWLTTVARRWSRTSPSDVRWLLIDVAKAVLPELGPDLGHTATELLKDRGVEMRLGVSVASATATEVTLTDGTVVPTRTLVWGAGVAASPLVETLGLPTLKGRLVVDAQLRVPAARHVWAAGDAAAVPDLAKAGRSALGAGEVTAGSEDSGPPPTPPTAQHAQRQGVALARNVAASLGYGSARAYRHRDLGLVADLGGSDAVAKPLGIPLTGQWAKAVTRGYHLYALPGTPAKMRVAADWLLGAALPIEAVQLSAIRSEDALIPSAEATRIY